MAKTSAKPAKPAPAAIKVPYKTLTALLGKSPDDPAVQAMVARAGKVTIKSDFILAKEAGFDCSLSVPTGGKKKVLSTLFLFSEGTDKHRGYADLPRPLAFGTRSELLAKMPAPSVSWKIGKGKVPVATDGVAHDAWELDGLEVAANYQGGELKYFTVSLTEEASGGLDLSTYPLHFSTKPADAPPDAPLVGMALLVAWAADRFGLPAKHAKTELGKQLVARKITPRTFLIQACNKHLSSLDFDPKLGDFLDEYEHHLADDEAREDADAEISKLLGALKADARNYCDDFLSTFAGVVDNPFHVPDSWDAVDRIAPIIDARLADYRATAYEKAPDLSLYRKAVKLRDARKVIPDRVATPKATADATLAAELVALIDLPLTDKHVKAVLTRAGMPIGKKIDQQANPALGVAYMGTKFEIAGKHQLGVDAVWFYANKQRSYIRGIGGEVEFVGYPAPLPHGLELGSSRAEVIKRLGQPATSHDTGDSWNPTTDRVIACTYANDKLVVLRFGKPRSW